ncbi:MAG: ACT domain-containing protein [Clostridia bacterium]|nr:ACT domain-containing protein [Clostridia bacterium]MBR5365782.1 ACT domain-containing protein [Clostridia bacterium]
MELEALDFALTVSKLKMDARINCAADFFFLGKTDEELSLVCRTEDTPAETLAREDGWRGFRVRGVLNFSLTGILARLTAILAEAEIGIFAVSTYNTDYILVKEKDFDRAVRALTEAGYRFV